MALIGPSGFGPNMSHFDDDDFLFDLGSHIPFPRREPRRMDVKPYGRDGFYYWLGARYRQGKIEYHKAQDILSQTARMEGDNLAQARHWFEIGQYNM